MLAVLAALTLSLTACHDERPHLNVSADELFGKWKKSTSEEY